MSINEQAVQNEVDQRNIRRVAAERETAPLLRKGWTCAFVGWALPIIPVIGYVGLFILQIIAVIISIVVMVQGNRSGGLKLLLAAWLGSVVVALLWVGVYFVVGGLFA